jgi:hypothetical protein
LHLSTKDKEHLEKFKECICSDHVIKTRTNKFGYSSVKLTIVNKQFVHCLLNQGIQPNKTTIGIELPIQLSDNLLIAWLRGYIDGDGSFWLRKRNNVLCFGVVSSKLLLLEQIQIYLQKYDIRGGSFNPFLT